MIKEKQFPDVSVELLEGNPYEVKDMVLNYQVDLGITTSPYQKLQHKPLLKDKMVSEGNGTGISKYGQQ